MPQVTPVVSILYYRPSARGLTQKTATSSRHANDFVCFNYNLISEHERLTGRRNFASFCRHLAPWRRTAQLVSWRKRRERRTSLRRRGWTRFNKGQHGGARLNGGRHGCPACILIHHVSESRSRMTHRLRCSMLRPNLNFNEPIKL